ncbi:MAG: glycosyltransferase family 4 protein [Mariniphaga sp.]
MDILYFCSPSLLDYSAEQIRDLKIHVTLHVVVTVFLHSPNHSIFKIKDEQKIVAGIYTFDEIKDQIENGDLFENYFLNCKTVHFIFFSPKFGINILFSTINLFNFIKKIKPQIIHFDDISGRLSLLVLFLRYKNIVLNVHDPLQHSGEQNWSTKLIRFLLFRKISAFCTFSDFSRLLFEQIYSPSVPVIGLRLVPYLSYLQCEMEKVVGIDKLPNEKILLFFGRISKYKGIDELLITFAKLKNIFPQLKLIIAGKGTYQYQIPPLLLGSPSLIIINRFIRQNEIKSIFEQADVLICPYKDATQSGVLMTAAIFNTPAIVSNVGALPEYIQDGKNGYIYDINDENGLEKSIVKFLTHNTLTLNYSINSIVPDVSKNSLLLVDIYSNILDKY